MTEILDGAVPGPAIPGSAAGGDAGELAAERRGRMAALTGGAPVLPLLVLFGLETLNQMDQSAFSLLIPNVRDAFRLSNAGILSVVALAGAAALLLTVPIAQMADRTNRIRLALVGAAVWSVFSFTTGVAVTLVMLVIVRSGTSIGEAVVFPTHNSLLADYYPIEARPRVYSIHRSGVAIGVIVGVLAGAGLTDAFSWRAPFVVFAVPTMLLVIFGMRLREPPRGAYERAAAGASAAVVAAAEPPPSFAEAYRMVWKIASLRRIFAALPFLSASLIGFASLAAIQYQTTFHLDVNQRAWIAVPIEGFELAGLVVGAILSTRLARKGPAGVFRLLAVAAAIAACFSVLFALAPDVPVAFLANAGITASLAIVLPGVLSSLSTAIPARSRAVGFSVGALFVLPGLIVVPLVGVIGDHFGTRLGMTLLAPVFLAGGLVISTVGSVIEADVKNVWTAAATRAELLLEREAGRLELLRVRDLDVAYDAVQVLFGVGIDVAEGEIVALLGTNGAGKSTLLKAIAGIAEAHGGAVVFDGRDITHAPPEEIARHSVGMVPGGEGVFASLTVSENLRAAGWRSRRHEAELDRQIETMLSTFPALADRLEQPAANLSGGEQQMLALAMAMLERPRLLLVDELSLGLAPIIVDQLVGMVREIGAAGTAVIVVEQSVDLALSLASRAYFMEKGEVRFAGSAEDLRARPDLLRSVLLRSAAAAMAPERAMAAGAATGPALATSGVSVSFGGIAAVHGVSISCLDGEVLGLIGPNGAGKTTLFDIISGFVTPDSGVVSLMGEDVTRLSVANRARRGLGRSFQDSRLFGPLTVQETLGVALERWIDVGDPLSAMLRTPALVDTEAAVARRVDELIGMFGLGPHRDKAIRELSTGLRRIVDLACVVAHGPSVVLLDEPSAGIAQREVEALVEVLQTVRSQLGATMLIVEHDLGLIGSVADRLVAMDRGSVVAEGSPQAVLADDAVISSYLGSDREGAK